MIGVVGALTKVLSMAAEATDPTPGVVRLLLTVGLGGVLAVLGVVLGIVESFLHPVRVLGIPVGVIAAAVVNFGLVHLVGRGTRSRLYALVPAATWLLTVIVLSIGRPEGDFVVPGTWVGYGYLIAGTIGAVVGVVLLPWYSLQNVGSARSDAEHPDAG